jgi:predicted RNA-binding protein with PIN domain
MAPAQPANGPHPVSGPEPSTAQLRPALELAWAVARARRQARPPLPIPGRMRRLVNAARLPERMLSTIRQVLEDDADFRAQVAEVADLDLLGRLAQLWLVRPEGWEEDLAALLQQYEVDRRRLDEEKEVRNVQDRIATLEQALARADAELQVLRRAGRDSGAAIEVERRAGRRAEAARRELAESLDAVRADNERLRGQCDDLSARVDELTRLLERARTDETKASAEQEETRANAARLEGEVAQTRRDLSVLRGEMESTRQSTVEALAEVAAAGRVLEESLRQAAKSLGLTPVVGPDDDRRPATDVPDRGLPAAPPSVRPKRTPVRLPPGVFEDEPGAADYLMRIKGMIVVVDGYNVSISSWPGRDLPDQRWRLVHALAELVARLDVSVRLYFDGVEAGGRLQPPSVARHRLTVEFSPSTMEADDRIIAFVGALDDSRPVTVATNDGRVRSEVARRGANVISVEQLLTVLRRFPDAPAGPE